MVNIELLKKLTVTADVTNKFEPFLFDDVEIRVNTLLENSDDVLYAFQVLKIPFTPYKSKNEKSPNEINVYFGKKVELNVIYLITYTLKEIYGDSLSVYINYATSPEGEEKIVIIGSYISRYKKYINLSRTISVSEILNLEINNLNCEKFSEYFPNYNYSSSGICACDETLPDLINYIVPYKPANNGYDYHNSYDKYGGYNDWNDDAIDWAFDGDPMSTWNVD